MYTTLIYNLTKKKAKKKHHLVFEERQGIAQYFLKT